MPTPQETLQRIRQQLGFEPAEVVTREKSGRRIKLPRAEARRRRQAQNAKAQAAVRHRRMALGLRGDGKPRRRAWRVPVEIREVRAAQNGDTWLRCAPTLYRFKAPACVVVAIKP